MQFGIWSVTICSRHRQSEIGSVFQQAQSFIAQIWFCQQSTTGFWVLIREQIMNTVSDLLPGRTGKLICSIKKVGPSFV